jgi:hypothetical protein
MNKALPGRQPMETLKDILLPIVLLGGLGALIDFLIGKAGQERAKDFLLRWWVRFDDVHWKNFGREEGLFAGRLIERWFGGRIWSLRRVLAGLLLLTVLMGLNFLHYEVMKGTNPKFYLEVAIEYDSSLYRPIFGEETLSKVTVAVIMAILGFVLLFNLDNLLPFEWHTYVVSMLLKSSIFYLGINYTLHNITYLVPNYGWC